GPLDRIRPKAGVRYPSNFPLRKARLGLSWGIGLTMDMIDATHTRWSTPGSQQNRLLELPSSPIGLADVLSNFLLVYGSARSRGMTVPAFAEDDRNLCT